MATKAVPFFKQHEGLISERADCDHLLACQWVVLMASKLKLVFEHDSGRESFDVVWQRNQGDIDFSGA